MPSVIACPSCAGQLRLPEELLGQEVRCPKCSNVFTPAAMPAVVPTDSTPRHESSPPAPVLSLDDDNGRQPEAAAKPRGLVGAVEVKLSMDDGDAGDRAPARTSEPPPSSLPSERGRRDEPEEDTRPCPVCGKRVARGARRCYHCDTPLFDNGEPRRSRSWGRSDRDEEHSLTREPERRDRVPSRGVLVLVLGIISLLCLTAFVSPLGVILGLVAWVMGHGDLNRMKAHEMDPDGGLTKGGWICGMIGTLANALLTLGCLGGLSMMLLENSNRSATSYDQPVQYKNPTPNGKDKPVQKQVPPVPQPKK